MLDSPWHRASAGAPWAGSPTSLSLRLHICTMEGTHAVPMRVLRWSAVLNACVASCTQMVLTYAPNMHLLNACCMPHAGITLGSRENLMSETVHTPQGTASQTCDAGGSLERQRKTDCWALLHSVRLRSGA